MIKLKNKAPERKLILPSTTNEKFVRKLVFLHNHLMQYYNMPYEEVMIIYERLAQKNMTLIYYEPKTDMSKVPPMQEAYIIYKMLDKYLTTGLITQDDMQYANSVWQWLKKKAGLATE